MVPQEGKHGPSGYGELRNVRNWEQLQFKCVFILIKTDHKLENLELLTFPDLTDLALKLLKGK